MHYRHNCRITGPNDFAVESSDERVRVYNQEYRRYAPMFDNTATMLRNGVAAILEPLIHNRLLEYFEEEAQGKKLTVCSYLPCIDDGEINVQSTHQTLIDRYRRFVIPLLSKGRIYYKQLLCTDIEFSEEIDSVTRLPELKASVYDNVALDEITHMLVPGIPLVRRKTTQQHTGWVLPRHPYGYDEIMMEAKRTHAPTKFVGIGTCCGYIRDESVFAETLQKPTVHDLVLPGRIVRNLT